jgi:L-threonylcarbamoyladenylate synthase
MYYRLTFSNLREFAPGRIPILRIDPHESKAPRRAVEALRRGEVLVYPTDTIYGLGCRIDDDRAVRRIYEIKNRPAMEPLPVLLADPVQVDDYAREISPVARRLISRFWPGPLTLVLRRSARIPSVVAGGGDTVALRVPGHPLPRALVRELGVPIVGTSANSHGMPSPVTAQQAVFDLGDRVDMVLDGGRAPLGRESTVVDATGDLPRIIREGALPAPEMAA